jgi:membrane protein
MGTGALVGRWGSYVQAAFHRGFAVWLWRRTWQDDVPARAAQLSYYFLLSVFPLLICLSAMLGYVFAAEATLEQRLVQYLGSMMPDSAFGIVKAATDDILSAKGGGKISVGLIMALWLASSGMEAVIEGLNVAFQVEEARPWWRRRVVALGLTLSVALLAGCAITLVLAGNALRQFLPHGAAALWDPLWRVSLWTSSRLFLVFAVMLVYFTGPNLKTRRKDQVILPGAVAAVVGWMAASSCFRFYLDRFSTFGATYGSLGAVIALLVWLYLTGAALLFGAEINSGIQAHLTAKSQR